MSTPWSGIGADFLSEGDWAIGQGPDSPDRLLLRALLRRAAWDHDAPLGFLDLGCGPGQFAECLRARGYEAGYLGIDFSPVAIEHARAGAGRNQHFELADLRNWQPADSSRSTIFVCTETLEHLDDDLELVAKIEPGRRLIFSVPNYRAAAHLRVFGTVGSVWERYGGLLTFRRWSRIDLEPVGAVVHLVEAQRRADAWGTS